MTTEFILEQVSAALLEYVVNTTLMAAVAPGIQTITPGSMRGIYQGAQLIAWGASPEVITVTSVTAATFTATFANSHLATDSLLGATFSSGQPVTPLWTQQEMLSYLQSVQSDFLVDVRPIYAIAPVALTVGKAIYPQPVDAIRVERISVAAVELWNTTRTDIDWQGGYSKRDSTKPQYWYQDKVGQFNFGVDPIPPVGDTANVYYSRNAVAVPTLLSTLLVPDLFWHVLKYGVLAVAWSKDGEQKDLKRSSYCQKRFQFGCLLARKFLEGLEARFNGPEETVEPLLAQVKL